jgi:hypothetical protein
MKIDKRLWLGCLLVFGAEAAWALSGSVENATESELCASTIYFDVACDLNRDGRNEGCWLNKGWTCLAPGESHSWTYPAYTCVALRAGYQDYVAALQASGRTLETEVSTMWAHDQLSFDYYWTLHQHINAYQFHLRIDGYPTYAFNVRGAELATILTNRGMRSYSCLESFEKDLTFRAE